MSMSAGQKRHLQSKQEPASAVFSEILLIWVKSLGFKIAEKLVSRSFLKRASRQIKKNQNYTRKMSHQQKLRCTFQNLCYSSVPAHWFNVVKCLYCLLALCSLLLLQITFPGIMKSCVTVAHNKLFTHLHRGVNLKQVLTDSHFFFFFFLTHNFFLAV